MTSFDQVQANRLLADLTVPVVCTLGAADQEIRLAEWRALLERVTGRAPVPGGLRLTFPRDPELAAQLGDLATRELECCSFYSFALRPTTASVELEVSAPEGAQSLVTDLFGSPA